MGDSVYDKQTPESRGSEGVRLYGYLHLYSHDVGACLCSSLRMYVRHSRLYSHIVMVCTCTSET